VIELRSAKATAPPTRQKNGDYMDNGASLGWLIDRKNRKVYIYRHSQAFEILDNPDGSVAIQSYRICPSTTKIW